MIQLGDLMSVGQWLINSDTWCTKFCN